MLICAVTPAVLFLFNLYAYRPPAALDGRALPAVSILVPARDEAAGIEAAIRAALTTRGVDFEIVVMDDGSTDGTDEIVIRLAAEDARVRLERAPALPAGWNGKQHACWALAHAARYPLLCFVDADVRLEPECVARMAGFLEARDAALVSGFPRQITKTFLEWMLLPLIHFVLLGFLPVGRMRQGTNPAFAAGCGQFLMARADRYFSCGGHAGIKLTMHDGLRLPKLFRECGYRTDLADITEFATCRMYTSGAQTWSGLAKNATEGLGAPGRIVPISALLVMGQVVPFALLAYLLGACVLLVIYLVTFGVGIFGATWKAPFLISVLLVSLVAAWLPRVLSARRFRQDWRSALLHPLGILLLLGVQWYSLGRKVLGRPVSWRARAYAKAAE